jgi:hypothetical protein
MLHCPPLRKTWCKALGGPWGGLRGIQSTAYGVRDLADDLVAPPRVFSLSLAPQAPPQRPAICHQCTLCTRPDYSAQCATTRVRGVRLCVGAKHRFSQTPRLRIRGMRAVAMRFWSSARKAKRDAQRTKGKGQVWETHSQTIRSDNWRDFRKKCLFQCGGPAGIRTQISGFSDRCSTVELQNQRNERDERLATGFFRK